MNAMIKRWFLHCQLLQSGAKMLKQVLCYEIVTFLTFILVIERTFTKGYCCYLTCLFFGTGIQVIFRWND